MSGDSWDPGQYERFKAERSQPFHDLLALVARDRRIEAAVDLGCGTGELTRLLHDQLGVAATTGIDSSAAMLEQAAAHAGSGLVFEAGDIGSFGGGPRFDLVFANAALQWVPDHHRVLAGWAGALRPGGQLAVQVPYNADHASHLTSAELALEEPFASAFGGPPPPDPVLDVLRPEAYASLLHELGFERQHVRMQVYGHVLASTADVVEWVKGTSLTRFKAGLGDALFGEFVDRYRQRLVERVGDHRPYFYPFKRILFWAQLPA